jgi:hypothetical protein
MAGLFRSQTHRLLQVPAYAGVSPGGPETHRTKVEWAKKHKSAPPYRVTEPGPLIEVSFMVKDSKRFPGTNGWWYATFRHDAASGTWTAFGDSPAFANTCHACHTVVKGRDYVYTSYAHR